MEPLAGIAWLMARAVLPAPRHCSVDRGPNGSRRPREIRIDGTSVPRKRIRVLIKLDTSGHDAASFEVGRSLGRVKHPQEYKEGDHGEVVCSKRQHLEEGGMIGRAVGRATGGLIEVNAYDMLEL
jgi:hypothetical protein